MNTSAPLTIGFISGFESPHASLVKNQFKGAQLAVKELNARGGILGQPVKLIPKDDKMDAALAVLHTNTLIEEGASCITGTLSALTSAAINRVCVEKGIPFFGICQNSSITRTPEMGPLTFHEALTPYMTAQCIGTWGNKNLGKKWYFIVPDYQWGYEVFDSFAVIIKKMGGTVLGVKKMPLGSTLDEFASTFPEILALAPDVLSVTNLAADQVNFIRAASQKELAMQMSIVHSISDVSIADECSPSELVGMYWGTSFYWKLAEIITSAKHFVEHFQKEFDGELPTGYAGYAYSAILEIGAAIEAGGTSAVNKEKMVAFLEGRSYDHYKGKQWWRPCDHQSFQDLYMMRFTTPKNEGDKYDIGEIVATIPWDLNIEQTCEQLGHHDMAFGHARTTIPTSAK